MGTYLDASDKLFSISDNSALHADFMVYEKDVHLIKEGQTVHFTVSNRPGDELTAKVFAIGKEFESNTRAVHIHANLDNNPGNLIPGMYISGHFHTDANYTQTLPDDAVVSVGIKSYIFIHNMDAMDQTGSEDTHQHDENESYASDDHEKEVSEIEKDEMVFRMMEVITGVSDEGYVEIKLLDSLKDNARIVQNTAYYLLADMTKEKTGHEH